MNFLWTHTQLIGRRVQARCWLMLHQVSYCAMLASLSDSPASFHIIQEEVKYNRPPHLHTLDKRKATSPSPAREVASSASSFLFLFLFLSFILNGLFDRQKYSDFSYLKISNLLMLSSSSLAVAICLSHLSLSHLSLGLAFHKFKSLGQSCL